MHRFETADRADRAPSSGATHRFFRRHDDLRGFECSVQSRRVETRALEGSHQRLKRETHSDVYFLVTMECNGFMADNV